MSAVLITYDLNEPGQNYEKLYDKIKTFGAWWHHLDSAWIIDTNLTVADISEKLRAVMDDSDSVLVLNITGDSYAGWLSQDAWNWLKNHV